MDHVLKDATTYGLGVAWGTELRPQPGEVLLASPDAVGDALRCGASLAHREGQQGGGWTCHRPKGAENAVCRPLLAPKSDASTRVSKKSLARVLVPCERAP
jgi:hypothetical protein